MKKLLLALSLSLLASSAFAADAIVAEPAPVFSWTGGYIGLQAGYAWGKGNIDQIGGPGFVDTDPDGFLGGVYGGYNYQMSNNIVIGAELDVVYANVDGSGEIFTAPGVPTGFDATEELKWSGAARLRLGYAVDRFLPYIAGGVAFGDVDISANVPGGTSSDKTFTGWTIGVGLDYAMTDNLLLRGEYRYTDFGSESFGNANADVDLKTNEVRLGIAYKF